MLKKRVIVLLTLSHGQLVRTKRFRIDRWYSLEFAGLGEADEIVVVDVTPGKPDRVQTASTMRRLIEQAMVPVTLGGRLRTLEDARWAFVEAGADKLLSSHPPFISEVAGKYGSQAAVFAVTRGYREDLYPAVDFVRALEDAGEFLIQDVERDGSLQGYPLDGLGGSPHFLGLGKPIVIGSGCGAFQHMKAAFDAGADGAATTNVLHFSAAALRRAKEYLKGEGVPIRA